MEINSLLKIPNFEYFKFKNIYSGELNNFNFKIVPDNENLKLKVFIWIGKYNLDKSEVLKIKEFDLTLEGWELTQKFILNEFEFLNN